MQLFLLTYFFAHYYYNIGTKKAKEMSSNIKLINQTALLHSLTYLELCVVPAFIEPYLSSLSNQQYRASFFLFMQTFAEANPDFPRVNITSQTLNECRRPIGQQLIYLLKAMLKNRLKTNTLSVGFFFQYDNNIQIWMIEFIKALLEDSGFEEMYEIPIKCLCLALGLSIDLYEIKRGNSKYFLTHSPKNQSFDLQMDVWSQHQKKYEELESIIKGIHPQSMFQQNNDQNTNLFGQIFSIMFRYKFTILDKKEKEKQSKFDLQNDQIDPANISNELYMIQEENISNFDLWYQLLEVQSLDMACVTYLNILRNYRQIELSDIIRFKNSIILLTKRVSQNRQDQLIVRTSYYSILCAIKLLINLKQHKDEAESLQESQNHFKEIISIQTCTIKSTYLFLSAFLQANLTNQHSYNRVFSLIGWIMNHYRKYNFKSEEMIYADFIANSLDILLSWKQYNRQIQDQKQIQTILTKLTNKVNDHSVNNVSVFFQTLNPTLLEFITDVLFRARKSYDQITAQLSQGNPVSGMLSKLGNQFKRFFSSFTGEEMKEKSKLIESAETKLSFVYSIQKNRSSPKKQKSILIKIYQIIKTIGQNDSIIMNDAQIQLLTKPCILQLTDHYLLNINTLLADYIISSSKKNQTTTTSLNGNSDLKASKQFIEQALPIYLVLNFILFLSSPSKNQKYLIFTMVLDSFSLEQRCIEPIIALLRKSKFQHFVKWKEQYSQIFKCSRRFDALELFDEEILGNMRQTRPQTQLSNVREGADDQLSVLISSFEKFCREWCSIQQNYQWFSEQKQSRIRLLYLKNLCTKVKEQLSY